MKKVITLLTFLTVWASSNLMAQIPNTSPIPVDFYVDGMDGYHASFDYSSMADFGDTLIQTVVGELAWAYSADSLGNQGDSLLCTPAINDLTGKVALIRRGVCNFSLKIYHAQAAGAVGAIILNHTYNADGGGLVGMSGGDSAAAVVVPAIFLTRDDGDLILNKVDNGISTDATFEVRPFGGPLHAYAYSTPVTGIIPLEDIGVTFTNVSPTLTIPEIVFTVDITDPNGNTATLTETITDVLPASVNSVTFSDSYTPSAVGEYTVVYSNSLDANTIERKFEITDFTYAQDNNDIVPNINGTIEPDSASFVDTYGFQYSFGSYYRTGSQAQTATYVTFILGNPTEIFTNDPESDLFTIKIFDADPDGNGTVPDGAGTSYDYLDESGGTVLPLAEVDYVLNGTEEDFGLINVELPEPLALGTDKIYLVMVEYNGINAGTGIPPKYAFGGTEPVAGGLGSATFTDSLHTRGWNGDYKAMVRLQLQGYLSGAKDTPFENSFINLSPNPASNLVNLEMEFTKAVEQVQVSISDLAGRTHIVKNFDRVLKDNFALDISQLNHGAYFVTIRTKEGSKTMKLMVAN